MTGIECPDCGSYDVVELDGVTFEHQCDNCGHQWFAVSDLDTKEERDG